jgi:hypothetical protein
MADTTSDIAGELKRLRGIVLGNGSIGHEQRIATLEEIHEGQGTNCIGTRALDKYLASMDKTRTFRRGDIMMLIALVGIVLTALKTFGVLGGIP